MEMIFSSFLQPRPRFSLSRSVGTGRSEPWERGCSFLFFVTFEMAVGVLLTASRYNLSISSLRFG